MECAIEQNVGCKTNSSNKITCRTVIKLYQISYKVWSILKSYNKKIKFSISSFKIDISPLHMPANCWPRRIFHSTKKVSFPRVSQSAESFFSSDFSRSSITHPWLLLLLLLGYLFSYFNFSWKWLDGFCYNFADMFSILLLNCS